MPATKWTPQIKRRGLKGMLTYEVVEKLEAWPPRLLH